MEQRINVFEKGRPAMQALYALGIYLSKSSVDQHLLNLIYFRVSQINGCAACLDMHSKDLRVKGETEQRLYLLDAWREAPFYTERERAALAWAEAITDLKDGHVKDEVYQEVTQHFSEQEVIDLTFAAITINSYNRVNVAFRAPAGYYQPTSNGTHAK
ncbi:carboxymuconolactone decarboxylase family protein [Solitalea canadensis]|uniref:Alkylhydroperoxidase AhpD family core domain protein n=1 Tax=Solitalea canadensis (strain ATCC 29591 / DSM 3403 / JCM 21819 / LMG 8368 / NBRC 15130 / NCIMB 12057 / USAM 9D) TaxID=929556 RepID=H8KPJ0_SOLCM|nr:carboxymuconolactone decarboxylase family protein [Solitalea canadensis]AFD05888.1 alkylhydroperoxidase AhpD family core domain protein [Solitalea canadensis DSM 3403]